MTPRLADDLPSLSSRPMGSTRPLVDREPILIPFVPGSGKPWYRRKAPIVKLAAVIFVALLVAYVVHRYTWVKLLTRFANMIPR